eukprot:jgi/Chrzof1/13077/Cz07g18290.t1
MYVPRVPGNAADGMPARNVQARDKGWLSGLKASALLMFALPVLYIASLNEISAEVPSNLLARPTQISHIGQWAREHLKLNPFKQHNKASGPGDVSPAKDAQEVLQCSIRSLLDSAVHDGEFQVQQLESQLKLVMEQQDITGNAAGQLIHKVHKLTSELKHLEKKKRSAVERGDYVAASHLQKEIDDVEFALMHLQYDVSRAWGQSDQLVNISVSLRKKQVDQLQSMITRLESLAAAAEIVRNRLSVEMMEGLTRAELTQGVAEEQMTNLGLHHQLLAVRTKLRETEQAAAQVLEAATEQLQNSRAAGRKLIQELSDLQLNLTQADTLTTSTRRHLEVMVQQLELAVKLEVYDHAASLQQASQQLKKALELSQQSSHVFAKKVDQLHAEVDRHLKRHECYQAALASAQQAVAEVLQLRQQLPSQLSPSGIQTIMDQLKKIDKQIAGMKQCEA